MNIELNFKDYPTIPEVTQHGLMMYVKYGIAPGSFLTAVLTNNLFEAYHFADDVHINSMSALVKFIYNKLPNDCYGTVDKVSEFIKNGHYH